MSQKLLQELNQKRQDGIDQNLPDLTTHTKQLLAQNAQEEMDILLNLGVSRSLHYAYKQKKFEQERKAIEERFQGKAFFKDEIYAIGEKYFLRFGPLSKYIGEIPMDLGAVLNRFCKDNGIQSQFNIEKQRFYILAPPNMFSDYQTLSDKILEYVEISRETRAEIYDKFSVYMDPELFYCPSYSGGLCVHVHGWGKDFTFLRRIVGILRKTLLLPILAVILFRGILATVMLYTIASIAGVVFCVFITVAFDVSKDGLTFHSMWMEWNYAMLKIVPVLSILFFFIGLTIGSFNRKFVKLLRSSSYKGLHDRD